MVHIIGSKQARYAFAPNMQILIDCLVLLSGTVLQPIALYQLIELVFLSIVSWSDGNICDFKH